MPDDIRKLKSALSSLAAEIVAAQADPVGERLAALDQRRRSAEAFFAAVRDRLRSAGGVELADALDELMRPLWSDLDAALALPGERTQKLEAAKARVDAALGQPRPHGVSYFVVPLEAER